MSRLVLQDLLQFLDAEDLKWLRVVTTGLNHAVGGSETAVKTLTKALCSEGPNEVLREFVGPLLFGRPGNSLYEQAVRTEGNYLAARCVLAVGVCASSEEQCGSCQVSAQDLLNWVEIARCRGMEYEYPSYYGGPHAWDELVLEGLTCHDECMACVFNPREVSIGEDGYEIYERLCGLDPNEVVLRRRFSSWKDAADLYRTALMRFVEVNELPNTFEVKSIADVAYEYVPYSEDYLEEVLVSSGVCYVPEKVVTRRLAEDFVSNAIDLAWGLARDALYDRSVPEASELD
jgi:hypothetical protein